MIPAVFVDTECLYSCVQNTSGGRQTYGFLGPHGLSLAADEELLVFGDIRNSIVRFDRNGERRSIIAFEEALQRGDLTIVSTPALLLRDTTLGTTSMVKLTGGALGVAAPCWTDSVSVSAAPIGNEVFKN